MEREEYWISWKNEGCPSFMKTSKPVPDEDQVPSKKRKLEDTSIVDEFISGKKLGMGRYWFLFLHDEYVVPTKLKKRLTISPKIFKLKRIKQN